MVPCKLDIISTPFFMEKFTYKIELPLCVNKFHLIYWMKNTLQSLILLIRSKIHRPVVNYQHKLRRMRVLLISIYNNPQQQKRHLMNSCAIILNVVNPRSRSLNYKGKYTSRQILNIFGPNK